MDQKTLQELRQDLLQEKDHLEEWIRHMTDDQLGISLEDSVSELSTYDNHPADLGSETFERSKDLALRENAKNQIAEIDEAMARMDAGNYGKCEVCGSDIPSERLRAMPSTTTCLNCRKAEEAMPDRHPRPIEEDVIAPPFGGFMHDSSSKELGDAEDENMFDGEDTWQAVAQYGTAESPQDLPNAQQFPKVYADYDEDVGFVEDVDNIPYEKDIEGRVYKDYGSHDDDDYPGAWEERVKEQVEERFNR